jgi:mRNA interferase HigB
MVNYLYVCEVFNIINRKAINSYAMDHPEAAKALREWYHDLRLSSYTNWNELKADYPSASLVGDDRVVFNILGTKYRLVVRVVFAFRVVQVKWFGTHAAYDRVDVNLIQPMNT